MIRIWTNPWIPDAANRFVSTFKPASCPCDYVADIMCDNGHKWNAQLIGSLFNQRDTKHILNLPVPSIATEDSMFWLHDKKCVYSVKSTYIAWLTNGIGIEHIEG